jgi:hypothetical protein
MRVLMFLIIFGNSSQGAMLYKGLNLAGGLKKHRKEHVEDKDYHAGNKLG